MAIETPAPPGTQAATFPYSLLRAGSPYFATIGMRRVTTAAADVAVGGEGRLYVVCRDDGQGGSIRRSNWDDEDLGTIGGAGTEPGKLMWPVQLLLDSDENLHISDEGTHRITSFNVAGEMLGYWGEEGSGPGQLNRPSGIALDADENIVVVDTQNHRVQKFTKDGQYISSFGERGSGPGQFEQPWGIA